MIRKSGIDVRGSNMTPDRNSDLKLELYRLQHQPLPFHPLIMVFSTGRISSRDCLPMARNPMPAVGASFSENIVPVIEDALRLNHSIHDGAIIFSRATKDSEYRLSAWSMRIISSRVPDHSEPNVGSAHNSALGLSIAPEVELCAIFSKETLTIFENGTISRHEL